MIETTVEASPVRLTPAAVRQAKALIARRGDPASTFLRLGVRGGHLPFGPGGRAPSEFGLAGGTGFTFSEGRGLIDFSLEHLSRNGVGLRERVWTLMAGITVRP